MAVYIINQNDNFDENDVSPAINDVVSKMKSGDSAVLEYGEYEIKNSVNIGSPENHLKYCSIALHGIYKYTGSGNAVNLRADFFDFTLGKLYTGVKSDRYNVDLEGELRVGINLTESEYGCLNIDEIEGFDCGIRLSPDISNTGIAYTKFRFRYISYCYIPIYFAVDDKAVGWINENQFYGGRLKGYYGVKSRKGKIQIDECNNNTFYNIAFESIETNAVDFEFCTFCTIISPRFESVMKYAIKESETCKSNKYLISVAIPLDTVDISSKCTVIEAPLHTYWEHMISKYMTDAEGKKSYEFFRDVTLSLHKETTEIPMNCKNIIIPEELYSAEIMLDRYSEFENNKIAVYNNSSNAEITVWDGGRNLIVKSFVLQPGKYELLYAQNAWHLIGFALENNIISAGNAAV